MVTPNSRARPPSGLKIQARCADMENSHAGSSRGGHPSTISALNKKLDGLWARLAGREFEEEYSCLFVEARRVAQRFSLHTGASLPNLCPL
jgi:hypothetical protein